MLKDLRAKMAKTISVCGVRLDDDSRPSDGVVVTWALSLACAASNPNLVVADRDKFLVELDKHVSERLAALDAATPEERRAMLEFLVAGSCDVSPFDMTAPLRAVTPEGGQPS